MTLTLRIENYDILEDGGPTWIRLNQRSASVGRRSSMDWVLPDPAKHISGHHFDVAFREGGYWLSDVSTNGTYLQGQSYRLQGPVRLQGGERLLVGHYVIAVDLDAGAALRPDAGWPSPAGADTDPWDFGDGGLNPVNPLPDPIQSPHHLDDVAQEFVPLQRPGAGSGMGQGQVQRPPSAPEGATQVSHPPFVPPPATGRSGPVAMPPASAMPPDTVVPSPPQQQGDAGKALVDAFCRGAGLDPAHAQGVDAAALAEALGKSLRAVTDETMHMLKDRASVKHFTRGGERTMRSATGNNPLKFLDGSEQALEAMFVKPIDGFMQGPEGFHNAMQDVRQHQMAVFAALQPALAETLGGLAPEDITGGDGAGNLLGGGRARNWETFVKRWDEKASSGDNGMLDVFLRAFSRAYIAAVTRGS